MTKMHDENFAKVVLRCNSTSVDPANPSAGTYNLLDELTKICAAYGGDKMRGTARRNPAERRLKSWLEKQSKKRSSILEDVTGAEEKQSQRNEVVRVRMMMDRRRGRGQHSHHHLPLDRVSLHQPRRFLIPTVGAKENLTMLMRNGRMGRIRRPRKHSRRATTTTTVHI